MIKIKTITKMGSLIVCLSIGLFSCSKTELNQNNSVKATSASTVSAVSINAAYGIYSLPNIQTAYMISNQMGHVHRPNNDAYDRIPFGYRSSCYICMYAIRSASGVYGTWNTY